VEKMSNIIKYLMLIFFPVLATAVPQLSKPVSEICWTPPTTYMDGGPITDPITIILYQQSGQIYIELKQPWDYQTTPTP
jgi:hypothetical protein